MRRILKSAAAAFSTYSAIPTPRVEFGEGDAAWSVCFFPLVGAAVGLADIILAAALQRLDVGRIFFAAVFTAVPFAVTGGIHMDGFIDASDALHSWRGREDKLRILSDPHVGAFGVICAVVYTVLLFGCFTELRVKMMPVLFVSYILSRALSGLSVVTFPKAKKDGMLRSAADGAARGAKYVLAAEAAASALAMVLMSPVTGGAACAAAGIAFLAYRRVSVRQFGGTTGDLAGWFLEICELSMLAAMVLAASALR